MIYFKNKKFHLATSKVHYIDKDEGEVIKYVKAEGEKYWTEFAEMWPEFKLIEFTTVTPSDEQVSRLDEINKLGLVAEIEYLNSYVEFGDLSHIEKGHPLYTNVLEKELLNTKLRAKALSDRQEFQEDLIAELAIKVYD